VREYLAQLLAEVGKIPADRIVDAACLDTDLRMESLAFIEIQVALEDRFDIEVDLIEVLELNDFRSIVDYLYDQVRQKHGS
jgi:acyl carrier protein